MQPANTASTTSTTTDPTNLSAASHSPSRLTPPRLNISVSAQDSSTISTSPRPKVTPRAVPLSPRLLISKSSSRGLEAEKIHADAPSAQVATVSMLSPRSRIEKYKDSPPPYSPAESSPHSLSPTKLTKTISTLVIKEGEKNEGQPFSEPLLTPRRRALSRHSALNRNTTGEIGKLNVLLPVSPRAKPTYSNQKIITSLSDEITKSALSGKPASLNMIQSLGRVDAVFKVEALPGELQSIFTDASQEKISSTEILRDLFSRSFKSGEAWKNAKKFILGSQLLADPGIKFGETNDVIKEKKLLILKPLAEDIANCLIGSTGLISYTALSEEFVKDFLFNADQTILEWALSNPTLTVKQVNLARCLFFYNLAVIRFIQPLITAEFGEKPSQMDTWMQSLILNGLHENIHKVFPDFLAQSGKHMPAYLITRLNDKASAELKNKRIAEFKEKSSSKVKTIQSKLAENKIERDKIKIKEKNLHFLNEIKKECGIADIKGSFADYIQSDVEKWLLVNESTDRATIILNLSFAITNYLSSSNEGATENILTINHASKILDRMRSDEIPEEVRRRTNVVSEDLRAMLHQNLAHYDSSHALSADVSSDVEVARSGSRSTADEGGRRVAAFPTLTISPAVTTTTTSTAAASISTTTTTTKTSTITTGVVNSSATDTVTIADPDFKENKN